MPVQEALAEQPARAERDLRLQDVIAGAERIALRIEEGEDAVLLVIVQELPGDRDRRGHRRARTTHEIHSRTPATKNTRRRPCTA